jgi:hypothetical protein
VSPDQRVDVALTLLTPILTAVLGVLGLVFGDWRQRRTQAGRRKLALDDASRQVAFAAEWWNARKLLADSPEAEQEATTRALAWLEEASALVAESKPPPVDERPAITLRRLLLLYPLQRRAARFLRGAFYICLGLVPLWVGSLIHYTLQPQGTTEYLFGEYFYGDLIVISALVVLAMALRFWARRVEKARPEGQKRRRVTLRGALLFYRFDQPAAKVVRIIFYISAVLAVLWAVSLVWEDPYSIPGNVVQLGGLVGYTVALRYWAASLQARMGSEGSRVASSATTVGESRGG